MTLLGFEAVVNQPVLNGSNGGIGVVASLPLVAAEGKNQAGPSTWLQPVAWEELTTRLFEADSNANFPIPLRNL